MFCYETEVGAIIRDVKLGTLKADDYDVLGITHLTPVGELTPRKLKSEQKQ